MPPIRITSACWSAHRPIAVSVEVDIQPGLPIVKIVGMPDRLVSEASARVRSAIRNSKLSFPKGRVTISLHPVHVPKQGSSLDAAIAVGMVLAQEKRPPDVAAYAVVGELDLAGALSLPDGGQPLVAALALERSGITCLVGESSQLLDLHLPALVCPSLSELLQVIQRGAGHKALKEHLDNQGDQALLSLSQCVETAALRACVIAVAGSHHVALGGRPGVGKTHIARVAQALFLPLSRVDRLRRLSMDRPGQSGEAHPVYRLDHGRTAKELTGSAALWQRALGGILLLDELQLYAPEVREMLKPWMSAYAEYARHHSLRLIALATYNQCPCGNGVASGSCACTAAQLSAYARKFPEALMQRFQVSAEVQEVSGLARPIGSEAAGLLTQHVASAADTQRARNPNGIPNGLLGYAELLLLPSEDSALGLVESSARRLGLSLRSQQSVLAVARTLADLEGRLRIQDDHVHEALQYRYRAIV